VVGSWLVSRLERFGFSRGDVRDLMVAGSAAGISAIFKTPLTGIIFALEVPYTDDLVREALIPSLVASISSYIVFVTLIGVEPLFLVTERFTLSLRDLAYTLALGLIIGLGARAYVASFHWIRSRALKMRTPIFVRTAAGGFVCGLIGLLSWRVFGSPVALGVGYETIIAGVAGHYSAAEAAWILLLKGSATLATLASGGAGGIFIPMIMLGVMSGGLLKALLPAVVSEGSLFPVVGMAAFLAAGYRAPIAAAVFVAESTGGAGYLIPGLVAAAVAYTVAGRRSISSAQRWRRETTLDRLLRLKVDDIMTKEVAPVPVHTDLLDFMQNYVVKLHHTSFPVTDEGRLVGMIALSDLDSVPFAEWSQCPVSSVMVRRYVSTTPDETVGRLLAMMAEKDVDVVPVVDRCESQCLVGVVSSADVIALDEVSADWVEKQRLARRTGATLS
jgi:CIC family chloride channel protein